MSKIHLISAWNTLDGIAIHAELLAYGLRKLGHKVTVFSPCNYEIVWPVFFETKNNEEVDVFKSFSFLRDGGKYFGNERFLDYLFLEKRVIEGNPDFIIIEKPTSIPLEKFAQLFFSLKGKKPRLIGIILEGALPKRKLFFTLPWDKVIVPNEIFEKLFLPYFGDKLKIVPFPFYSSPIKEKEKSLLSGEEKNILVITSIGRNRLAEYKRIRNLCENLQSERGRLKLNFLKARVEDVDFFLNLKKDFNFVNLIFDRSHFTSPSFHNIVLSSEAILFIKKNSRNYIGLSSMMAVIAGFLRPIIVPDIPFFADFKNGEVIKYKSFAQIKEKINQALKLKDSLAKNMFAKVKRNTPVEIAKRIINGDD